MFKLNKLRLMPNAKLALQERHINHNNYLKTIANAGHDQQPSILEDLQLLSAENGKRCINELQKISTFNRPVSGSDARRQREQAYASVLIPLCTTRGTDEISLLYTRRAATLSRHRLQVSFPGGLRDETDTDYIDCALRETQEEIGLKRERIQIWGHGSLMRLPHTAAIMPVVGVIHDFDLNELKLNKAEVNEAFTVPIRQLLAPDAARHTQFKLGGYSGPVFIDAHKRHIWGITGYLTYIFLRCLLPTNVTNVKLKNVIKFVRPYKAKN